MGIKKITHPNGTSTPDDIIVEYAIKDSSGSTIKDTYVNKTTNQVIDGQKDFNTSPRLRVEHNTHDLPEGYQEVEYIESTGSQYINTGVKLSSNHSVEVDYQLTTTAQTYRKGIFGYYATSRFGLLLDTSSPVLLEAGYGSTNNYYKVSELDLNRHIVKQEKEKLYVDGVLTHTFSQATFTTNTVAPLGTFAYTNYNPAQAKYYESKWWNGDTLIRWFIPCYRISDEVSGMYDKVNGEFYSSATSTPFVKGPDIFPIMYESFLTNSSIPTKTSQLMNDSGYITSSYHDNTKANQSEVNVIQEKIPSAASSSNQLADKAFVNSSIETATATFRGTFDTLEALQATSGDLNDYAFYRHTDSAGNTLFDRYKYTSNTPHWVYEYTLNNSSFTAVQWEAINSGVSTGSWVDMTTAQTISGQKDFNTTPRVRIEGEQPREGLPTDTYTQIQYVESDGSQYIDTTYAINTATDVVELVFECIGTTIYKWLFGEHDNNARFGLGVGDGPNRRNVAYGTTTYKVNDTLFYNQLHNFKADSTGVFIDGTKVANYSNFSSTSSLALFCLNNDGFVNGTAAKIQSYKHTRNGNALIDLVSVKRNSDGKAGFYDFVSENFIGSATGTDLSPGPELPGPHYEALITDASFSSVAFSGEYNDLNNRPTIPTVFNATLTIQKNGTNVGTFTSNASSNSTVNIIVPTQTSDITNNSGFITSSVNDLTYYTLSASLSAVATSGSYNDLINTPTIPTDTSNLTNGAGFITSSDVSAIVDKNYILNLLTDADEEDF